MIVFLRGFTHGLAHEIKQFVRNERGVVALIFAVLFPIIVGLLFTAFQFDMYNRNITRVEMAQSSALHAGRNQASDAEKIKYTKIWVKLNTDFVSGLNALRETDILARIDEGKKYLYVRTTMDDLSPVVSWAVKSHFQSIMRIPLENDSTPSGTCGDTYWRALYNCGKKTREELRKIPNSERLKADQMALINIAKAFFKEKTVGTETEIVGLTKSEMKNDLGMNKIPDDSNDLTSKPYLILNYVDSHKSPDDSESLTYMRDDDSIFLGAVEWMQSDHGDDDSYLNRNQTDYIFENKVTADEHARLIDDNDSNDDVSNQGEKLKSTRFFFSDWMLEDMHGWTNVKSGYQDNARSVRIFVNYDGDNVQSVRVAVNRGLGEHNNNPNGFGTYYYELDVTVTADNYSSTDLSSFQTNQNTYNGKLLSGLKRYTDQSSYKEWYKKAYKSINGSSEEDAKIAAAEAAATYRFDDIDSYYTWYKMYLTDTRAQWGASVNQIDPSQPNKAEKVADRIVKGIY